MRKRLRKKRRLGEFREDCFEVSFRLDRSMLPEEVDQFTDEFIDMIERSDLQFGGSGDLDWSGITEGPWRGTVTETNRSSVLRWLQRHPKVIESAAGPLRDAWHGWE